MKVSITKSQWFPYPCTLALVIKDTENQPESKASVEHDIVIPNIGQRSKCFLVAIAKYTTVITDIMDCLNSFTFFSKIHAYGSRTNIYKWRVPRYKL